MSTACTAYSLDEVQRSLPRTGISCARHQFGPSGGVARGWHVEDDDLFRLTLNMKSDKRRLEADCRFTVRQEGHLQDAKHEDGASTVYWFRRAEYFNTLCFSFPLKRKVIQVSFSVYFTILCHFGSSKKYFDLLFHFDRVLKFQQVCILLHAAVHTHVYIFFFFIVFIGGWFGLLTLIQ